MHVENSSSFGYVPGKYGTDLMVCQLANRFYSQGCAWIGCNPLTFVFPLVVVQLLMFLLVSRMLHHTLKRFRQSTLNCQVLAGLLLGRSIFGKVVTFKKYLFPPGGRLPLETLADIGFIFHLFVIGLHIDITVVKRMGKEAVTVGIASFLSPFIFCVSSILAIPQIVPSYNISIYSLIFLVTANSMTSFAGTTSHLSDLQILNSDIGRLATLAAMVNDTCNYLLYVAVTALTTVFKEKTTSVMWSLVWNGTLIAIMVCVIRPVMVRFAKSLPEGQPLKENHFVSIMLPALVIGFLMEIIGMPAGFGSLLYGSVLPDGPPLGTGMVHKLDSFSSGVLLPAKFGLAGASVDVFEFRRNSNEMVFALIVIMGYIGKFIGVLIAGLFFRVPLWDSVCLALVMCCRGVVEMSIYISLKESGMIANAAYAILLFAMLIVTGIARPLIVHLYDPWKRYAGKQLSSVLNSNQSNLRILVCIYGEDNVGPIIDLLSVSNPTRESPIFLSVMNLVELKGRSAAVLERNVYRGRLNSMLHRSENITKAFDYLEGKSQGTVALKHFTSVAPYATMHSDICTIALEVQAHIIIVPFHKQKQIDGSCQSHIPAIRIVNQNLLKNAPSTVGILIDRSHIAGTLQPIGNTSNYLHIFVLFLGGGDDREALAYGIRMLGHPKLNLTLVWLRPVSHTSKEDDLDVQMIKHFRANTIGNDNVTYREEMTKDAVGTIRLLRSFEGDCDLCIVGRYHPSDSPLTQGMITDWSDCPELGAMGEMLSTADCDYSVLVVKQEVIDEPEYWKQSSFHSSV